MTSVMSALGGLLFVLGLIFLTNYLLRRFGASLCAKTEAKREITLLDVKPLDAKNKLVLARCREKDFLILTGESNAQIAVFDAPAQEKKEEDA